MSFRNSGEAALALRILQEHVKEQSDEFRLLHGRAPKFLLLGPGWARKLRFLIGFVPVSAHYLDAFDTCAWFWGTVMGVPVYTLNDGIRPPTNDPNTDLL